VHARAPPGRAAKPTLAFPTFSFEKNLDAQHPMVDTNNAIFGWPGIVLTQRIPWCAFTLLSERVFVLYDADVVTDVHSLLCMPKTAFPHGDQQLHVRCLLLHPLLSLLLLYVPYLNLHLCMCVCVCARASEREKGRVRTERESVCARARERKTFDTK
jgi:hypothetical protein